MKFIYKFIYLFDSSSIMYHSLNLYWTPWRRVPPRLSKLAHSWRFLAVMTGIRVHCSYHSFILHRIGSKRGNQSHQKLLATKVQCFCFHSCSHILRRDADLNLVSHVHSIVHVPLMLHCKAPVLPWKCLRCSYSC